MIISLTNIYSSYDGFCKLAELYKVSSVCKDDELIVDMLLVTWMDANMCAPFGAILHEFRFRNALQRDIELRSLKPSVRDILQKNGFLKNFGFQSAIKSSDIHGTTIEYQVFQENESHSFKEYVSRHFVKKGIPDMTPAVHKRFRESIHEIFDNAAEHSDTKFGIFVCGQHFPSRHRLDFSITDLGIGFRENIRKRLGHNFSAEEAITWAVEGANTTRLTKDGRPGGLGLKFIKEFIGLNKGKFQIISNNGYWLFDRNGVTTKTLTSPFPGTVVNIEIDTSDKQSYYMAEEITANDIF